MLMSWLVVSLGGTAQNSTGSDPVKRHPAQLRIQGHDEADLAPGLPDSLPMMLPMSIPMTGGSPEDDAGAFSVSLNGLMKYSQGNSTFCVMLAQTQQAFLDLHKR